MLVPILTALAAVSALIVLFWPGVRGRPLWCRAAVAASAFVAVETFLLGGGHLIGVILENVGGTYDFRLYSLVSFGFLMVIPAVAIGLAVPGLMRNSPRAWHHAFWASVVLLGSNLPLVPIQGFALTLSVLAAVNLLILVTLRSVSRGRSHDRSE